jgi:hypothetical protein
LRKEDEKEAEKQQTMFNFKSKQQGVPTKEGRLKAIAEFIVVENQVC